MLEYPPQSRTSNGKLKQCKSIILKSGLLKRYQPKTQTARIKSTDLQTRSLFIYAPCKPHYLGLSFATCKKSEIAHGVPGFGCPIYGINEKDMTVKFAECIEGQLLNAGLRDIRLALELDMICGTRRRTASDLCGGNIKIESLCHHPTHRLWNDYVQK